jgi:catechol 2,3-dioxygenase-like lactoylglutathione lyase family enzyme
MLTRIMYVALYVSDLDRALAFYTEQLGLEKRVDVAGPDGRFLTVAPSGESVEILLWPGRPVRGAGLDASSVVPGPVFIESEDLREDFVRLRDCGVTFEDPEPIDYPFGVRITALDPDGNRIELRQRKPSGEDA